MNKSIRYAVLFLMLQGCATSYQHDGITGGYTDKQLADNIFTVVFQGNISSSKQRVHDFALRRGAELTLQHGFRYFVVSDSEHYARISEAVVVPPNSEKPVYDPEIKQGNGQKYNVVEPAASITIECYKEQPAKGDGVDAQRLYDSLSAKYKLKKAL